MILKYLMEDGSTADHIDDGMNSQTLARYKGEVYLIEHENPMSAEPYIMYGGQCLDIVGSVELIAGREVNLYYNLVQDYDLALSVAEAVIEGDTQGRIIGFGLYDDKFFTEEKDGFKVDTDPDNPNQITFDTLIEVKRHIDMHF
ncbi:hypothetical protein [Chitinophaga sp. CF418]|uniref:hypothetical protein n=1 Tax=Chitinophaga sp. CF418 TaxID=1855287 RepID=UPI0009234389|nr:hypothetical protein [Chitinophaga sp. CF418]SHN45577.1 hypothetical protein SAMN05216311_120116 [Chitinophaga sp. CF418]